MVPRLRIGRRKDRAASSLVLLGLGAAVGVAVGALLADRVRRSAGGRGRAAQDPWLHVAHGAYDDGEDEAPPPPRRRPARTPADDGPVAQRAPSIERRVLEAFRNDPVLAERAIDIGEDAPGVIALAGWVRDDAEIRHAATIAGGVPGVARVESTLAVRTARRPWTLRGSAPDGASRAS
jgi:hypothetical protein